MSWNNEDPKQSKNQNTPQNQNKPSKPSKQSQADGPPDLDDLIKKIFGFGKKKNNSNKSSQSNNQKTNPSGNSNKSNNSNNSNNTEQNPYRFFTKRVIMGIVSIIILIWVISGIYIVQPAEKSVVLRFGKYYQTQGPGMHWYPPFIDSVITQNVDEQKTLGLQASMLTSQENVVSVEFVVQYKIGNLQDYLFNVVNPNYSLQEILESAVRQAIGTSDLENILTIGRAEITQKVQVIVSKLVNKYQLGIKVVDIKMLSATPPTQVKAAFDDVIKAREDNQRFQNEAQTYANSVVPIAKGKATRILQQADAYKSQLIYLAKGAVAKFNALLPEYNQAKNVTVTRLYFDAMTSVLDHSKLVLVDSGNKGSNMFYVPLNEVMGQAHTSNLNLKSNISSSVSASSQSSQVNQAINSVDASEAKLLASENKTFEQTDSTSTSTASYGSPESLVNTPSSNQNNSAW